MSFRKSNMITFLQIKGLKMGEMTVTRYINCVHPTLAEG